MTEGSEKEIKFLTVEEIKFLQEEMIQRYGGSFGIRDEGLLASAVHRPQSGYYETIYEMAAALLHSLITNHVFVDGNKRVAFAACDVFLLINRRELRVPIDDAEAFLIQEVIQQKIQLPEIASWLQKWSE